MVRVVYTFFTPRPSQPLSQHTDTDEAVKIAGYCVPGCCFLLPKPPQVLVSHQDDTGKDCCRFTPLRIAFFHPLVVRVLGVRALVGVGVYMR